MNDIDDFFLNQMKGVNPIIKKNKIDKENPKIKLSKKIEKDKIKKEFLKNPKTEIKTKKSEFKLENVDIKRGIKRGFFKIDKKIDFHGRTLLDSEEWFSNTILKCHNKGLRCLLFVTGKGLYTNKNADGDNRPKLYHGVIRSALINWVKSKKFSKYILSYEPASIGHGGDGAFYVYLRKKKTNFTEV
ncbi:Smr/MutS family protein [Alphaproteobacteria bacterium]|nr:Smr/MutS family protein [Alphaproteobacteria bacterium]